MCPRAYSGAGLRTQAPQLLLGFGPEGLWSRMAVLGVGQGTGSNDRQGQAVQGQAFI